MFFQKGKCIFSTESRRGKRTTSYDVEIKAPTLAKLVEERAKKEQQQYCENLGLVFTQCSHKIEWEDSIFFFKKLFANNYYRHITTGKIYFVHDSTAKLKESEESFVIYEDISTRQNWLMPKSDFFNGPFVQLDIEEINKLNW